MYFYSNWDIWFSRLQVLHLRSPNLLPSYYFVTSMLMIILLIVSWNLFGHILSFKLGLLIFMIASALFAFTEAGPILLLMMLISCDTDLFVLQPAFTVLHWRWSYAVGENRFSDQRSCESGLSLALLGHLNASIPELIQQATIFKTACYWQ